MSPHRIANPSVAIVGAGPYGLSIAAYLRALGLSFRIFGKPMLSWQSHMPAGMFLKSEGFASDLYDPHGSFPLSAYCAEHSLPYMDIGRPVPLETFVAYGLAFQQRFVPDLETTDVDSVTRAPDGFEITTSAGETFRCSRVVIATGITHFGYLPPVLSNHPDEFVTHSYAHADLSRFRSRSVVVVGGGASAIDIAVALHEIGADVKLITRRQTIAFHEPPGPRSLMQKILAPRSGLGVGWRSWLCTNAPSLFYTLPARLRSRAVERHLGPAPGWFMKDRVLGKFPLLHDSTISDVNIKDGKAHITWKRQGDEACRMSVDHIIGATGYRVNVDRLSFIEDGLRGQIAREYGSPILDRGFMSSVPGLYVTGVASANSFGPLMRFACGARFTARRLAQRLSRHLGLSKSAQQRV
jgi:thioredoxin reductase